MALFKEKVNPKTGAVSTYHKIAYASVLDDILQCEVASYASKEFREHGKSLEKIIFDFNIFGQIVAHLATKCQQLAHYTRRNVHILGRSRQQHSCQLGKEFAVCSLNRAFKLEIYGIANTSHQQCCTNLASKVARQA